MSVPFIDIKRFEAGFFEAWLEDVKTLTAKAHFIGGEPINQLETNLAIASGSQHVVSCANGTDAIQLALRALGVREGDKVLLPDLTFWATFEAIINVGAKPVLLDCNLVDQTLDIDKLSLALTQIKPKVVMIVHLYGWAAQEINVIRQICQKASIPLLEDSAQAFGVKICDTSIFTDAFCATTSFYPAKVLGGAGDGGAVFCQDKKLADRVRQLSNHGRSSHYGYGAVGWNSRMDTLQAAFINRSLQYINQRITSRKIFAQKYRQELANLQGLKVVAVPKNISENGYCNVCFVEDLAIKAKLEAKLKENNIGFGNIYPSPMSEQIGAKPYIDTVTTNYCGKNAKWICEHVINLPLFAYMTQEEFNEVIAVVKSIF